MNRLLAMNTKRLLALLLAPGLLALGIDAWIGHFAGQDNDIPAQWIPVFFAPAAMLLTLAWGALRLSPKTFRRGLLVFGGLSVVVGLLGTYFHVHSIIEDLRDDNGTVVQWSAISWADVRGALGSGPPLLAPLSFAGLGVLLMVIPHQRLILQVLPKGKSADELDGKAIEALAEQKKNAA